MNKIPEWYLPLLEKIQKNLNEDDLKLLKDIVDHKFNVDMVTFKRLSRKMVSWLNTWEKMKFAKMLYFLNVNK